MFTEEQINNGYNPGDNDEPIKKEPEESYSEKLSRLRTELEHDMYNPIYLWKN